MILALFIPLVLMDVMIILLMWINYLNFAVMCLWQISLLLQTPTGSLNKAKAKKKGVAHDTAKLPAITTFASGGILF